ncbi:hypothetical protein N9277_01290, partial [bacterium]|nr:hypothetical protein [bacterium]
RIIRTAPTISQDQAVTVIAEIAQPFSQSPPLSIGTFVNASLAAKQLSGTYRITEASLINDAYLWTIGPDDKLVRLEAERLHSDLGFAYVSLDPASLELPLRIVSRPLTNFESGTLVKPIAPAEK